MNWVAKLDRWVAKYSGFNDVLLAIILVMVISLMIVPVPPAMLDALISLNLTISVVMFMMSKYIPNVL